MSSPIRRYRLHLNGIGPAEVVREIVHRIQPEGIWLPLRRPPPIDTPAEIFIHYGDGPLALLGRGWVSHSNGNDTFFELEWTPDSDQALTRHLFGERDTTQPTVRLSELEASGDLAWTGDNWDNHIVADLDAVFLPSESGSSPVEPPVPTEPISTDLFRLPQNSDRPTLADLIKRAEADLAEASTIQQGLRRCVSPERRVTEDSVPMSVAFDVQDEIAAGESRSESLDSLDVASATITADAVSPREETKQRFSNVEPEKVAERWDGKTRPAEEGALFDPPAAEGWLSSGSSSFDRIEFVVSPPVDDLLADLPALPKRRRSSADFNVPCGAIFGVELGTSAVTFAIAQGGQAPRVLELSGMGHSLPAVAAMPPLSETLVGASALEAMVDHPRCGIQGVHRLLGLSYWSSMVPTLSAKLDWMAVEGNNARVSAQVGDRVAGLDVLVGKLLRAGVEAARVHLSPDANRIVLTCPTIFRPQQRASLVAAAEDVGLCVEALVPNCLAAVVQHCGLHYRGPKQCILVVGLDAGALDIALVEVQGRQFSVLASGGDGYVGGFDGPSALEQWRANRSLEEWDVAYSNEPELWVPLADKVLFFVREVCERAQVSPPDVEELILFGAQSREPQLAQRLQEFFDSCRLTLLELDVVALGAAEIGRSLDLDDHEVQLLDRTVSSLGLGHQGGQMSVVVPRDTLFPAFGEGRMQLAAHLPPEILLFEGDASHVEDCDPYGRVILEGLPMEREQNIELVIRVCVGEQGQVDFQAIDASNGSLIAHSLELSLPPDHIDRVLFDDSGRTWVSQAEAHNGILGWLRKKLRA